MRRAALWIILALALSSCSLRARELTNLEPIETLCITLNDGRVKIIACAAVRDEDNVPLVFQMEGDTVSDAVEKLKSLPEGKDAIFVHTKNILCDTRYCAERLDELKAFLRGSAELKKSACVFCADDAAALLDKIREGEGDISADLEFLADKSAKNEVTRAHEVCNYGRIFAVGEQFGSVIPLGVERF